jgi:hypothetical protein
MPSVSNKQVLKATYDAVVPLIRTNQIPTTLLYAEQTVFRSCWVGHLPKPAKGQHMSKHTATVVIRPNDGATKEKENRFSGPSYDKSEHNPVRGSGGLYCVLQQQALVNENIFYWKKRSLESGKPGPGRLLLAAKKGLAEAALADRCVAKIALMSQLVVADLSPHNPGTTNFLKLVEETPGYLDLLRNTQYSSLVSLWHRITDGDDCSVARGIGLAIANSHRLKGLVIQTVRKSGRSPDELGDNLVLFGREEQEIPNLYVDEVFYFDDAGGIEIFPAQFP